MATILVAIIILPVNAFLALIGSAAIAGGSLVGTWMNDSAFWVFSRMGGTNEVETLRSWTLLSAVVGITAAVVTVTLALLVPLR